MREAHSIKPPVWLTPLLVIWRRLKKGFTQKSLWRRIQLTNSFDLLTSKRRIRNRAPVMKRRNPQNKLRAVTRRRMATSKDKDLSKLSTLRSESRAKGRRAGTVSNISDGRTKGRP